MNKKLTSCFLTALVLTTGAMFIWTVNNISVDNTNTTTIVAAFNA